MKILKQLLAMKYILLLDVLMVLACVWIGVDFRRQWNATAQANQLSRIVPPTMAMKQALDKQKSPQALEANYMVIASRNLFSPDRNDQLPKEDAVKVRPPKPILFGVMNLPDAKIALMSPPDSRAFRSMKVGDKIGEYTLTKIMVNKVELKYGNETLEATTEEQPKTIPSPVSAAENTGPKVVSVDSSGGPLSNASSGGAPNASPAQPAQGQGPCKGRWVKTLFGMVCVEDGK